MATAHAVSGVILRTAPVPAPAASTATAASPTGTGAAVASAQTVDPIKASATNWSRTSSLVRDPVIRKAPTLGHYCGVARGGIPSSGDPGPPQGGPGLAPAAGTCRPFRRRDRQPAGRHGVTARESLEATNR